MAERYNVSGAREVRLSDYEVDDGEGVFVVRGETFEACVTRHRERYFVSWTEYGEGTDWRAGWWAPPEIRHGAENSRVEERDLWFELLGGTARNFAWRSDTLDALEAGPESTRSRWTARRLDLFVGAAEEVAVDTHADLVGLDQVMRVKSAHGGEWVAYVFSARIRHLPYQIAVAGPATPPSARRWLVLPNEPRRVPVEETEAFVRFIVGSPYDRSVEGSPWFETLEQGQRPARERPRLYIAADEPRGTS